MDIHNPLGATEITELYSRRLDTLNGKRIALLSNDSWQAHRTLPLAGELLKADYSNIEIISYEKFPIGNSMIDSDLTVSRAKELDVDGVLIGNAA